MTKQNNCEANYEYPDQERMIAYPLTDAILKVYSSNERTLATLHTQRSARKEEEVYLRNLN